MIKRLLITNSNINKLLRLRLFMTKFATLLFLLYSVPLSAKPIKVVYIPPGYTGYWETTAYPLPAIGKQLGLDITIIPVKTLKEKYVDAVEHVVTTAEKPDWVIWTQRRNDPKVILDLFEKHNIKSIDVTSGFLDFDRKNIGYPQQFYSHWIAQVVNDEYLAGQHIATELINRRKHLVPNNPVKMIAIAGGKATKAAQSTLLGLQSAFENVQDATLVQTVFAHWNKNTAQEMTRKLFLRHQRLDVIWAANTDIALGVTEQLNNITFNTYPKPLVANLGWNNAIFNHIKAGNIAFSMGGNHLSAMWALILIHDHEHGYKIAPTLEATSFSTPYVKATRENIEQLTPFLQSEPWSNINIKPFSKVYNPALTSYNFDLSLILSKQ
jgi:ABC-type sugar transport system substrate-binding protein